MAPKIKNIILFLIIAVAFILIYIFFIKSSPQEASLVTSGTNTTLPNTNGTPTPKTTSGNSVVAQDFLVLLLNVKNIKLDDAIFSDPAFNNLHDSSITLTADGNEGRPNPFAQFGNDGVPVTPTTTPSTTTPSSTTPTTPTPTSTTTTPTTTPPPAAQNSPTLPPSQ